MSLPHWKSGIRGWLAVFVGTLLLYSWVWVKPELGRWSLTLYEATHWKVQYAIPLVVGNLFSIFMPPFVVYALFRRRTWAIRSAKVFLVLLPIVAGLYSYQLKSSYGLFDFPFAMITSSVFSLVWFLYITKSRRVQYTYLFTNASFPPTLWCPQCGSTIALDKEERSKMQVECPECGLAIDKENLARLTPLKREKSPLEGSGVSLRNARQ